MFWSLCNALFVVYYFAILICSLRGKAQLEQLLRYIIEEPPEDADKKNIFKWAMIFFVFWDIVWILCHSTYLLKLVFIQVSVYCMWDIYLWCWYHIEGFSWGCTSKCLYETPNSLCMIKHDHSFLDCTFFLLFQLLDLLFSFLKPDHPHSTLLAGYFSKVITGTFYMRQLMLQVISQHFQAFLCV